MQLESAKDADTIGERMLPQLVASTAQTLHLRHAAVELVDGTLITHGIRGPIVEELPLVYGAEPVGSLVVTPRSSGLSRADRTRLTRLASQVSVAAHGVLLTREVRRSREQLVVAQEEERRRLYRELHDGLGPSLAALALQVETAHDTVAVDPVKAIELLDRALPRLRGTVSDVRSMIQGLRPPTLDHLGLAGAVRELAAGFAGPRLAVRVDSPDELASLPAATEVATYWIIAEALSNVSRHANATEVTVQLSRHGDDVHLSVIDNGCGLVLSPRQGMGLASMHGRATELGGSLDVEPGTGGRGTTVRAILSAMPS